MYLINGTFSMLAVLHLTYLGSIFGSSTDDTDSDEVQLTFSEIVMAPAFCVSYYLYLLHDLNAFLLSAGRHGLATPLRNGHSSAGQATG